MEQSAMDATALNHVFAAPSMIGIACSYADEQENDRPDHPKECIFPMAYQERPFSFRSSDTPLFREKKTQEGDMKTSWLFMPPVDHTSNSDTIFG
jgi:2-keto-4-pentenoate hydratase/2-oxohepta-3-ene-1,7-dioic acid hydratase in catechol pathway